MLVTGISRDIGRRFARAATGDPSIDRVIGVDAVPPRGDIGDVSFVRADIRNPVIAKVIAKEDVDTVVHMSVISTPGSAGGRNTMKELNVIGTMQLLAACQKAPGLKAQADLFTDPIGHARPPLQLLATYCHFAVIYRRSPVGLPVPAGLPRATDSLLAEGLNRLLQELAWEAAIRHPLSGVKGPAKP